MQKNQTTNDRGLLSRMAAAVAHAFGSSKGLDQEEAAAESGPGAIRKMLDEYNQAGVTPKEMSNLIQDAAALKNLPKYYSMAERLEEADLQYRSLISTRKLAVCGLDIVVEPSDTSRQAKKVAALVRNVLASDKFLDMLNNLMDAISKGTSIVEIIWDLTGEYWVPGDYKHRPMRWFGFDEKDATVPRLVGPNNTLVPLKPNKFIIHQPQLKSGLPVRGGLAMAAAWGWVIKALVLTNWLGFCEVYGQPFRIGTFEKGAKREDVLGLKKALQSLGTNAYAVLEKTMAVQFVEAGGKSGSSELFEKIIRYIDEQLAKLVLGQTLTSGSGDGVGSQALGKVHNEVRADILRADARQVMATVVRDLITPLVALNFGPGTALPTVRFQIDEPEDLVGLKDIVSTLVGLGAKIPLYWVHDKFGIPEAEEGEETLAAKAPAVPAVPAVPGEDEVPPADAGPGAPAAPEAAANSRVHCPVHSAHASGTKRDALDDLNDTMAGAWVPAMDQMQAMLEAAVEGATDYASMRAAVAKFIKESDFSNAAEVLANARAIAQLAGRADLDIGGK